MDHQIFELLDNRFDRIDRTLDSIKEDLEKHAEQDRIYWRQIDVQNGQITLLKILAGAIISVMSAIGAWFGIRGH